MKNNSIKPSNEIDYTNNMVAPHIFNTHFDVKKDFIKDNATNKRYESTGYSQYYSIIYIEKGYGEVCIENNNFSIEPNSLFILTPGQMYCINKTGEINGYKIEFSEQYLIHSDQMFIHKLHFDILHRYNKLTINYHSANIFQKYFELIYQEFGCDSDDINKVLLRQLLICILCKIEKLLTKRYPLQAEDSLAVHFKKLVDLHFKEWHHVHHYITALNTTRKSFEEIVFNKYGRKPADIIIDKLINQSKMMLHFSEHSIKFISVYLGFTDVSNYCKFFKCYTGITPKEYRKIGKIKATEKAMLT